LQLENQRLTDKLLSPFTRKKQASSIAANKQYFTVAGGLINLLDIFRSLIRASAWLVALTFVTDGSGLSNQIWNGQS